MARAKSTSGGKTTTHKEQTSTSTPASVLDVQKPDLQKPDLQKDVQPVAAETAAVRAEAKVAPEPRKKLEVVKTERRVVPINLEDEIRRRAYELYQQRGNAPGSEAEDWLAAEREVRQRYHQQQSA